MNKKLYGYVTTQKFGDFLIPVPFQNIILLDYSRKKKYALSFAIYRAGHS